MKIDRKLVYKCEISNDELLEIVVRAIERKAFMASRAITGKSYAVEVSWKMKIGDSGEAKDLRAIAELFDERG